MRDTHYGLARLSCTLAMVILGCSDGSGPTPLPKTGSIEINVVTTAAGIDLDADGYVVLLDRSVSRPMSANGTLSYPVLAAGQHFIRLEGLAPNCSVQGDAEHSVEVVAGEKASLSFNVSCVPNIGDVKVTTVTSGADLDTDGYTIGVTGMGAVTLPANGTRTISGLRVGAFQTFLQGVAPNCRVASANPVITAVTFGTIEINFDIRCSPSGVLEIKLSTTGVDFDPSGFEIGIVDPAGQLRTPRVPANGSFTLSSLGEGSYRIQPRLLSNCSAPTAASTALVVGGTTTTFLLDIVCTAAAHIAYVRGTNSTAEIHIVRSNGIGDLRLTTREGLDADPAWSPDGSRIVFTTDRDGNREIYVMREDGTDPVRLTTSSFADYRPAWSPDGSKIAFVSERDGNSEIYVMNADGSNAVNLTISGSVDTDPEWSPDGSKIAFVSNREASKRIWIMNADGSNPHVLTSSSTVFDDGQPAWSPDGQKIAFSRGLSADVRDVFIINTDGTGLRQVTAGLMAATDPAWSRDGKQIAIAAISRDCQGYYGNYYSCDPYLSIYDIAGNHLMTFWELIPSFDPAWGR